MTTHGGKRNRSGPAKDPQSARSEREGIVLTALPNEGYTGGIPEFPLSVRRIRRWEMEDKHRFQVVDEEETELVADREQELWEWAWRTPQAAAWSLEPWRWQTVAMWVRTFVICEGDDAKAADKGALHRFADQIGLTPAGLVENGWAIAQPDISKVVQKPSKQTAAASSESKGRPERRMRAV